MLDPSLPDHCEPSNAFVSFLSSHLDVCIPSTLALISTILGFFSIISWLFAQLPQIFKNHALQSTSGLSIAFLVEWCLGDTTNLVGALFTRQAVWQVVVAGYYVCVDVVLVGQYIYYTHVRRPVRAEEEEICDHDTDSGACSNPPQSKNGHDPDDDLSPPTYNPRDHTWGRFPVPVPVIRGGLGRSMLAATMWTAASARPLGPAYAFTTSGSSWDTELVGRVLSWSSTLLYLGSRLPQIYKNRARQSTQGLSARLFVAAFFGNLFYSTSLLTNPNAWNDYPPYGGGGWVGPDGSTREDWIARAAPFFLGAAGVLILDAAVGVQFLVYDGDAQESSDDNQGWMRGWIPAWGAAKTDEDDERRSLLKGKDKRVMYTE